jgi:DHA2 family multidrug resistance protein
MTAPVGWLAARYGRKPLYVGCILGFTIASMLCGAAQGPRPCAKCEPLM